MYAGSSRRMTAKAPGRKPGAQRSLLFFLFLAVPLPEQQGNAPQARYAHQGIDDAAQGRQLAAADKCYAVEGEKPTLPQFSAPMMTKISAMRSMIFKGSPSVS